MFKMIKIPADPRYPGATQLEFYVRSKPKARGNGFFHEAVMLGFPAHKDGPAYSSLIDRTLFKLRYKRCSYVNRTWEAWPGQQVLKRLWEQLAKMSTEFPIFDELCPFDRDVEPDFTTLAEPDAIFGRFKKGGR